MCAIFYIWIYQWPIEAQSSNRNRRAVQILDLAQLDPAHRPAAAATQPIFRLCHNYLSSLQRQRLVQRLDLPSLSDCLLHDAWAKTLCPSSATVKLKMLISLQYLLNSLIVRFVSLALLPRLFLLLFGSCFSLLFTVFLRSTARGTDLYQSESVPGRKTAILVIVLCWLERIAGQTSLAGTNNNNNSQLFSFSPSPACDDYTGTHQQQQPAMLVSLVLLWP